MKKNAFAWVWQQIKGKNLEMHILLDELFRFFVCFGVLHPTLQNCTWVIRDLMSLALTFLFYHYDNIKVVYRYRQFDIFDFIIVKLWQNRYISWKDNMLFILLLDNIFYKNKICIVNIIAFFHFSINQQMQIITMWTANHW